MLLSVTLLSQCGKRCEAIFYPIDQSKAISAAEGISLWDMDLNEHRLGGDMDLGEHRPRGI